MAARKKQPKQEPDQHQKSGAEKKRLAYGAFSAHESRKSACRGECERRKAIAVRKRILRKKDQHRGKKQNRKERKKAQEKSER